MFEQQIRFIKSDLQLKKRKSAKNDSKEMLQMFKINAACKEILNDEDHKAQGKLNVYFLSTSFLFTDKMCCFLEIGEQIQRLENNVDICQQLIGLVRTINDTLAPFVIVIFTTFLLLTILCSFSTQAAFLFKTPTLSTAFTVNKL